ncbi:hypothetical protein SAMN06272759_10260 [Novosphingobium sp. B1]|nr:hypothetical protein SAMN06272759_10260 [Novosphingobium sp. B1]
MDDLAIIKQRRERGRQVMRCKLICAQNDKRAILGAFKGAQCEIGTGGQAKDCPIRYSFFTRLTLAAMIWSSGQHCVRSRP